MKQQTMQQTQQTQPALPALRCASWFGAGAGWLTGGLKKRFIGSAFIVMATVATAVAEDLLPVCTQLGVGLLAYFPLENGLLTGKYRRSGAVGPGARLSGRPIDASTYDLLEALEQFAQDRSRSLLNLAISGLLIHPTVSAVITGATRPEQIHANAAAGQWQLSTQEIEDLRLLLDQFARIDHCHAPTPRNLP